MKREVFYKTKSFLNEYSDQIHKNEDTVEYNVKRGGSREGSGRPSLGQTKRISLTLPDQTWNQLNRLKNTDVMPLSTLIRHIIIEYFENKISK